MKWFDRQFDFSFGMECYRPLLERLQAAPSLMENAVAMRTESALEFQPDGKWSAKEHLAHLFILEPLWRKRFDEIRRNQPSMSAADLNNTATTEGDFNKVSLQELTRTFNKERILTVNLLLGLNGNEFAHSSLHPRLQKPMRIIDLMYFVAEHDDHHLGVIQKITGLS